MDHPEFTTILYRDLVPYKHAIWSSIAGGTPFANTVGDVQYTKDGRVSVMLESHNFLHGAPDEEAPSVVDRSDRLSAFERERVAAYKGPRRHDAGLFDG